MIKRGIIYQLIIFIILPAIGTWRIFKDTLICLKELIQIWYLSFITKHFNALKAFNLIASIWFFKDVIEFTTVSFSSVSWGESNQFRYDRTEILNDKRHKEFNKIVFNKIAEIVIRVKYMKSSGTRGCHNHICRNRHRLLSRH